MMTQKDRGFILLSTLFLITLFASIAISISANTFNALAIAKEDKFYPLALKRALRSPGTETQLSPKLHSLSSSALAGGVKRGVDILRIQQTRPDFNALFEKALPCSEIATPPLISTLTPASYLSAHSCLIDGTKPLKESLSVIGNLVIPLDLLREPGATYLAATGFIEAREELTLGTDLTLLSGGDIHINGVQATEPIKLHLYSASGAITIKTITGPVTITAYARVGIYLPSGTITPFAGDVPLINSYILGVETW